MPSLILEPSGSQIKTGLGDSVFVSLFQNHEMINPTRYLAVIYTYVPVAKYVNARETFM